MIYIGYTDDEKRAEISRYTAGNTITKIVVISADEFPLPIPDTDQIRYSDVIKYVVFYRLLQEINSDTLIIINECLRTQNRYDLAYNCIRNYLNQTSHQLIFQQLPQIDTRDDFMILFDFDTRSRWKRRGFDPYLISQEARLSIHPLPVAFEPIDIPTSKTTKARYQQERDKMFAELGKRDPHIIPRNLYLIGGQDKLAYIDSQFLPLFANIRRYVARNKRLGRLEHIITYDDVDPGDYTILELPHRFIDFADFIKRTGQTYFRVLLADLKVDHWYFQRYTDWARRLHDTYSSLS